MRQCKVYVHDMEAGILQETDAREYVFTYGKDSNRQVQSMLHHIDENDDFGIMLATAGHDTIGAVTIKPM